MNASNNNPSIRPRSRFKLRISISTLCAEPFRILFPCALLGGIIGVVLWPLHFAGIVPFYPGTSHARLMGHGFFGGFIVGFLGTALPRLLDARSLLPGEVFTLLLLYILTLIGHTFGSTGLGDFSFLTLLLVLGVSMGIRFRERKDLPPPGFVLVAMGLVLVVLGIVLAAMTPSDREDLSPFQLVLPRLLLYQGFILPPILGAGVFMAPKFFGSMKTHEIPESRTPNRTWFFEAAKAGGVGLLLIGSFLIEVAGWYRAAHWLRLVVAMSYLLTQIPIFRAGTGGSTLASALKTAFLLLFAGFLCVAVLPKYRVPFLHITLMGGFAIITLTVATRVVFGHSGNRVLLEKRNRWFVLAAVLMLAGMATRISGDLLPSIMVSHYNYGALLWVIGILIWAAYVIPNVLVPDPE